jgi:hypothetical protein
MKNKQALDWLIEFYVRNDEVFYSNARSEVLARHPQSTVEGTEADASRILREGVLSLIEVWTQPNYLTNLERKFHDVDAASDDTAYPEYRAFCLAVAEELDARVKRGVNVCDNVQMGCAWRSALTAAIDRECQYTHKSGLEKLAEFQQRIPNQAVNKFDQQGILDVPNYILLLDFFETAMAKEIAYFRQQYLNEKP